MTATTRSASTTPTTYSTTAHWSSATVVKDGDSLKGDFNGEDTTTITKPFSSSSADSNTIFPQINRIEPPIDFPISAMGVIRIKGSASHVNMKCVMPSEPPTTVASNLKKVQVTTSNANDTGNVAKIPKQLAPGDLLIFNQKDTGRVEDTGRLETIIINQGSIFITDGGIVQPNNIKDITTTGEVLNPNESL